MNELIIGIIIGGVLTKIVSELLKYLKEEKLKEEDIEIARLETLAEELNLHVLKKFIKKYKKLRDQRIKYHQSKSMPLLPIF
jgi:uncharacterized membrane-anchored protein YhcB (DUF1043 family)